MVPERRRFARDGGDHLSGRAAACASDADAGHRALHPAAVHPAGVPGHRDGFQCAAAARDALRRARERRGFRGDGVPRRGAAPAAWRRHPRWSLPGALAARIVAYSRGAMGYRSPIHRGMAAAVGGARFRPLHHQRVGSADHLYAVRRTRIFCWSAGSLAAMLWAFTGWRGIFCASCPIASSELPVA